MIWLVAVLGSVGAGWLLGHGDAAANARIAAQSAPQDLLTAMLGVTIGLYGRERIRLRRTYASPSLAFVGKGLVFSFLSPAAAWTFAPLDWSPLCLHLSAAGCAAGACIWLGNLPSRL
jgi:hypothetical protein